ncbi:MAG: LamG domain-containing protein, partial [Chitinophagales bacterium]|nr:LamG domain-containing protein [Chitinophagales bacterium]
MKKISTLYLLLILAGVALGQATTFNYTGGMQTYTVPSGVTSVIIETWGAQGGDSYWYVGGYGARMKGTFSVTPGQVLKVMVGGKGGTGYQGGGGGGTFVTDNSNNPLCIAGGGGGGAYSGYGYNPSYANGTTSTSGQIGQCGACGGTTSGAGGAGPNGGGTDYNYGNSGAGGGGLTGNGANAVDYYGYAVAQGGKSFVNGGAGGAAATNGTTVGSGGYGGGGGGDWNYWTGAGGGGGYGGGGGGTYYGYGGGGGSYNGGSNQDNASGVRSGNGQAVITPLVNTFCTWSGPSNQQSCCSGLGTPPCGSTGQVNNIGSGTYTYLSLTAGKSYTFSTCGSPFGTDLSLWYYTGSGNAMGNNGGWAPQKWNGSNGPDCSGNNGSFTYDAPYTSGNYILILNRTGCGQHDFTGVSATLKYRENGNPTLTATPSSTCSGSCNGSVSLSMGGGCQTHTMTTGTFEQFNTPSVALNGYNGMWTYSGAGTAATDGSGQAYFYNGNQQSWSNAYYTNQTVARSEGLITQGRFYNTGTYSMVGWHNSGTGTSYTDLVYALYPAADGRLYIYEDGNYRGDFTNDALPFVGGSNFLNRWIEYKIVLKASGGATYYIRNWTGNMNDPWFLVYHTNYSTATNLRAGVANYYYNNQYFYIDDMFMGGGTQYPPTSGLCAGSYTYAAQDQYGNLARASATVSALSTANNPGAISLSASSVCAGTAVTINNVTAATTGSPASSGPNYYYYWNDGSGWRMYHGPTTSLTSTLPSNVTNTPGTYTIARNSEFGCASQTSAPYLTLTVTGNPTLTATPTAGCGTSSVSLGISASGCSPTLNTGHYDMFTTNPGAVNSSLYTRSGAGVGEVDESGQLRFYGNDSWAQGFFTNGTVSRVAGRTFQGRWYNTGSYSMIGWHDGGTGVSYTDLVYALYPYNSGGLQIYEDGNYVGDFTSQASGIIGLNKWIEFKIVLRTAGAEYYIRNYNAGENWRHIYTSSYSSESNLRAGLANYSSCCWFYTDDWFVGGLAQYPATTGLYAGTYYYGGQDAVGNVATTSVNVSVNRPSVALSTTVTPAGVCSGGSSTLAVNTAVATGGLLNYTTWAVGTGSATGFGQNGLTAENQRINGTGPWGNSAVIWETKPSGDGNADGGWNTSQFSVDETKMYRFSVWVKRTTTATSNNGNFYMGVYGFNSGGTNIGTENLSDGATNTNPYWDCPNTASLPYNEWILVVGHVYPKGSTYTGKHPNTGRWNLNGVNIAATGCNIGTGDVRWKSGTVTALHRTYHYYSPNTASNLQFLYPRVDVIDGSEPSLQDLINGFDVNGGLGTGATWQWNAGSCGGSSAGTGVSVSVAPTSTTNYFVRAVGTCNTSSCKEATVTVNPLPTTPTITAGGPTTFCNGGSVQLTASSSLAGNALSFNGTQGINLGNPPKLRIAGNMTIEMWLYPTDFSQRRNPYNKAYAGEGTITQETNGTLNFYQGSLGADGGTGACSSGNYEGFNSSTALTINQWNHIALVRDMAAGQLRWYINGNLTNTVTFCQTPVAGNNPVIIGAGYTSYPYIGQIDEVRIWNVARTTAEVQNNRFTTVAPGSTGLAGYYRFDETSGSSVFDASGNSVTGTLGASPTRVTSTAPLTPTYTWSPATGLNTTTGNVVTASPTSTQTYTVSAASPHGCGNSTSTQTVTVTPTNTITLTS